MSGKMLVYLVIFFAHYVFLVDITRYQLSCSEFMQDFFT